MISGLVAAISSQLTEAPSGSVISGTARPGNTLTSTAAAQWRINGVNISGQTSSTLNISRESVVPTDVIDQVGSANTLSVVGYDSDAATDIAAVVSAGSDWGTTDAMRNNNRWSYDDLIIALKAGSVYATMDDFYRILAGPTTLAGALACGKGGSLSNVNFVSGDYNRITGLKSGATKYINSGKATNSVPQNDISVWMYVTETVTIGDAVQRVIFGSGGSGGGLVSIYRLANSDVARAFLGGSGFVTLTTQPPSSWLGLTGFSRSTGSSATVRTAGANVSYTNNSAALVSNTMRFFSDSTGTAGGARGAAIGFHPSANLATIDSAIATYLGKLQ